MIFKMHINSSLVAVMILIAGVSPAHAQIPSFRTPYVTRAESAMLLLQARVPKIPALLSNGAFTDVPRGIWYERYIVVAERLGILQAHPVTRRIRPDDPVTRAEFISMAGKTFGINTLLFSSTYSDVSREAWYAAGAGMAQRLQLFPGDPDQSQFRPEEFMIHSEVAKTVQILSDATANAVAWKRALNAPPPSPYQNISTSTQNIALVKPRGPAPHLGIATQAASAGSNPSQISKLRQDVLALVNAERAKAGLAPLKRSVTLETSAQQYAQSMAKRGFFGHTGPGGETLKDRMEKSGYYRPFFQSECFCVARYIMGENLARGQKTAKEVVTDWMQSPAHKAAITTTDFTDTGIGIVAGVWVQHFGGKQK